jgi:hypothetical protein
MLEISNLNIAGSDSSSTIITFYKIYIEADLASVHYVTFIEPLAIIPVEPLSFSTAPFYNTHNNDLLLSCAGTFEVHFDDLMQELLDSFS